MNLQRNRSQRNLQEQSSEESRPEQTVGSDGAPSTVQSSDHQSWRLQTVVFVLGALTLLLVLRLVDMQVRSWSTFAPTVHGNTTRHTVDDTTSWGVIVDRDGVLMAADRYTYRITATPNLIEKERWSELADLLEQISGTPAQRTWDRLNANADSSYVVLDTDVGFREGRTLLREQERQTNEVGEEEDPLLSNVHIEPRPRRFYPQGELASQVLGFVNAERKPVLGVERYYDRFLPMTGVSLPKGGRHARTALKPEVLRFLPQGQDKGLILTLDRTVQWIIEEELREGVRFYRAESGTVIVMDPGTGAILGMANYPTFDANHYESEDANTFTNSAVSAQYEPGSIFKLITVASALDSDSVDSSTVFTDSGTITLGERTIQNSGRNAAGLLSVADALAQSNNVVTVQIARTMEAEQFYDYVARFGFGTETNIDLSGEVPGLVKNPGDPLWSLSDLATNSFGQGLAVTPIQMVSAVSAIVNQGRLMRPYIVQARVHGDETFLTQPTTVHRPIHPDTAREMRELMVHTVETGNRQASVPGYKVGGKSGTAEIATEGGYLLDETIASFVGYAPADDPKFVVLIKLDRPDPDISRWAAYTAAPLFSRIAYRLLDHMNVPPDEIRLAQGQ